MGSVVDTLVVLRPRCGDQSPRLTAPFSAPSKNRQVENAKKEYTNDLKRREPILARIIRAVLVTQRVLDVREVRVFVICRSLTVLSLGNFAINNIKGERKSSQVEPTWNKVLTRSGPQSARDPPPTIRSVSGAVEEPVLNNDSKNAFKCSASNRELSFQKCASVPAAESCDNSPIGIQI